MDLDDEVAGDTPTDTSAIARRVRRPTVWAALAVLIAIVAIIALISVSRVGTGTNGPYPVTRQAALQNNGPGAAPSPTQTPTAINPPAS